MPGDEGPVETSKSGTRGGEDILGTFFRDVGEDVPGAPASGPFDRPTSSPSTHSIATSFPGGSFVSGVPPEVGRGPRMHDATETPPQFHQNSDTMISPSPGPRLQIRYDDRQGFACTTRQDHRSGSACTTGQDRCRSFACRARHGHRRGHDCTTRQDHRRGFADMTRQGTRRRYDCTTSQDHRRGHAYTTRQVYRPGHACTKRQNHSRGHACTTRHDHRQRSDCTARQRRNRGYICSGPPAGPRLRDMRG